MGYSAYISELGASFEVLTDESILDAAIRNRIEVPYVCRSGICGTCRIKVLQGTVGYAELPLALTREEHDAGYAQACQAVPESDIVFTLDEDENELPSPVVQVCHVHRVARLTKSIFALTLRLPADVTDADYLPGQYANLRLPDGDSRSFSFARSAADDNLIDFHIRHVEGGRFSDTYLSSLAPDDPIEVEMPHGQFYYRRADDARPLVCVATGTGLGPIYAILESLLDTEDVPPVTLYWGMRQESDLYARATLQAYSERLGNFSFVPVLSRPEPDWLGRRGYVQDAIAHDFNDMSDYALYLCGAPQMISAVKRTALALGADAAYIYSEGFSASEALTSETT